jgi:two-component system, cell cycle sensor histidine kinase and response regulator CckA
VSALPSAPHTLATADTRRMADFLQAVVRTAGEGICAGTALPHPPFGRFSVWNDRMTELTGYTLDEINEIGWFDAVHPGPDRQAEALAQFRRLLAGEEFRQVEGTIVHKDGSVRAVTVSTRRLESESSPAFVVLMTDVTERKREADARKALEDQLREARRLESIGVLAAGIAHEFNNLLTTILGHADLAEAEVRRASPAQAYLESIKEAGRRAAELCRQMLAYAGRGRLVVGPVDLAGLAREAATALGPDIPIDLDLSADLPPVRGDAEQLRQLIANLLTNAVEAVAGIPGRIRLAAYWDRLDGRAVSLLRHTPGLPPGEYVVLEIKDEGPGMDDATLARAFEPFYSTKFPGRGLGLPVVLGVVRVHGGGLDIDCQPGRGTTVRVYLPVADS